MASTLLFANSFSENPTTTIRDYSENHLDGVGVSTVAAADTVGYYLSLDGAADYYTVANTTDYCNANFTICLELYLDTLAVTHNIINTYNVGLTKYCFSVYAETGTNNIVFYMEENGGGSVSATRTITATAWHKVVCTYNNSTGAMKVYLNTFENVGTGTLVNSVAQNGEFCVGVDSATKAVAFMDGRLRDVRFYTSMVSDDFIKTFLDTGATKGMAINIKEYIDETGTVTPTSKFNVGDMIASNARKAAYFVVYAKSTDNLFCLPFNANPLLRGDSINRIGHRWDTARQYSIEISQEGEAINVHNLVTTFSTYDAGSYITTQVNKNGIKLIQKAVTTTYTAKQFDAFIKADATSAAFTITLPTTAAASGCTLIIKKIDSSANAVTIDGDGSETIDGATTYVLSTQYDSVKLYSNGSVWYIV